MKKTLHITLEGKEITDISAFYKQINEQLMREEDWQLGESLDALDDLLYGGIGRLKDYDRLEIYWNDIDISRANLGVDTTKAYYSAKIYPDSPYNQSLFSNKLAELEKGMGDTYFDLLMDVINSHSDRVKLISSSDNQ